MSTANLHRFLDELYLDLEGSSDEFRDKVANRLTHALTFSARRLTTQTKKELRARNISFDDKAITNLANRAYKPIEREIKLFLNKKGIINDSRTRFDSSSFVAYFSTLEGSNFINNFKKVKSSYKVSMSKYYRDLQELLDEPILKRGKKGTFGPTIEEVGGFFNVGHEQDKGVLELRVREAVERISQEVGDWRVEDFVATSKSRVAIELRALMAPERGVMRVTVESKHENIKDASKVLGKKTQLLKSINRAINRITRKKGFPFLEGSDSPIEVKRKQAAKIVIDKFDKVKGLKKVKSDDLKIKKSSSKGVTKKIRPKVTRGPRLLFGKVQPELKLHQKTNAGPSLFSLAVLINAKLPETVAKNMGFPKLVWRKGRFAESVQVMNVIKTPKGFPSFEYTYQRDPYQVFEVGIGKKPWSTINRDPKKIISKSIREIAATFAIGRFYTRRV